MTASDPSMGDAPAEALPDAAGAPTPPGLSSDPVSLRAMTEIDMIATWRAMCLSARSPTE